MTDVVMGAFDFCGGFRDTIRAAQDAGSAVQSDLCGGFRDVIRATQSIQSDLCSGFRDGTKATQDAASRIQSDLCSGFRDGQKSLHDAEARIIGELCDTGRTIERVGGDNKLTTERNGGETRAAVERNGGETRAVVERDGCATRAVVRETTCDIEKSLRDGFGVARVDSVSGFKDALRDAERIHHQTLLNQEKIAAAAQLTAFQNQAALSKQLAECCCEQKELIRAQADETRSLVRQLDNDRTARELQDTKNELAMLRLRSTLPPAPVASTCI